MCRLEVGPSTCWEDGGSTDIDNGFAACRRHHRKIHAGYRAKGNPNGELRFYGPDGTFIGSSYPAQSRLVAVA